MSLVIQRNYLEINKLIDKRRSVLILGPRGSGKTYYLMRLFQHFSNTLIINLLDKQALARYLSSPGLIYKEIESRLRGASREIDNKDSLKVLIDEVQLIPSLLDEVQRVIEEFKPRVVFVLTGSSARKLKRYDANLLAGRAIRIDFFPLGIDEVDCESDLSFYLRWGNLPETYTLEDDELRLAYLQTYVGTYLDEEVRKEAQVRELQSFARFLEVAAAENGQVVNYSKLARAAGIADVTVKEYFQILHDTLLAYYIPAWSYSTREQLQKAPKYYLFDNGVINALLGELQSVPKSSTYRYGRLFENFVLGQLMQHKTKTRSSCKIYHYRSKSSQEIDFIVQKNPHSCPVAVEIKSSTNPGLVDVKQLIEFRKKYPESKQFVICNTPNSYIENDIAFLSIAEGIKTVIEEAESG